MTVRYKLAAAMLVILIVPVIIVAAVFSSKCSDAVCEQQIAALKTINNDKANFISEFLSNIIVQEKIFTTDESIKRFADMRVSGETDAEILAETNASIKDFVRKSEGITDTFIMDFDGTVIAANEDNTVGTVVSNYEELLDCLSSNGGISRFFPPTGASKCAFYACRTVYSNSNERAGVLVERVGMDIPCGGMKLTGYGNAVSIILVDSEGRYITSSVSTPRRLEEVVEYRGVSTAIPEAIPCFTDSVSRDTVVLDKNKEKFVYFGTAILNGNWSLVILFDRAAAVKNVNVGGGLLVIIVLIIASAALFFVCYKFTEPINKIIKVITQKNRGDSNIRLELESNDEFGKISYEFNEMFDSMFESEQRYRTVVSMMDNVVFEVNLKNFTVYVSNNFNKKFSFRPKDETLQESFLYKMKVHKDDMKRFKDDLEGIVAAQGEKWQGEYRLKNFYGDFSWIKISGKKFYDRNNAPAKIIGMMVDIDREKKATINLTQKASFDALTQLYNRQTFMRTLDEEMFQSQSRRSLDALMFIDLDDFKHFNDEYGHKCGDEVLKFVADTIKEVTYEKGFGGRLGGDEFVMCLTKLKLIDDAGKIAAETINILNEGFISESTNLHLNIHCSIGIAFFRENGSVSAELLEAADTAMYKIKKSGKSNFAYANDVTTEKDDEGGSVHKKEISAIDKPEPATEETIPADSGSTE